METNFKYIVYLTINTVNNKIYIGVHQTATLDFDGYIGNGIYVNTPKKYEHPKTLFQKAVKKYGPGVFKRTIIKTFNNLEDALDLERWLVDETFVKRPDTYNMVLGGHEILPTNSKSVYLYDKSGNFVIELPSRQQASLFIYGNKKNGGNITRAINTGCFCKEYQISNIKVDFMKDYESYKDTKWVKMIETFKDKDGTERNFGNPKKVGQYDKEGNLITVYKSLGECKRAGFTNAQGVIEGNRNHCKGYIFKYIEEV